MDIKVIVLLYHRILPNRRFDIYNLAVSQKTFIRQLESILRKYPVFSLSDVLKGPSGKSAGHKVKIALTFDDGFVDNYKFAVPILERRSLPATFFLTAEYIDSSLPLEWQIIDMLSRCPALRKIDIEKCVFRQIPFEPRKFFISRIIRRIKSLDILDKRRFIEGLRNLLKIGIEPGDTENRCMSWDEVGKISEAGFEIGSHGLTHRSLRKIPFPAAKEEIRKSKEIIEDNLKKPCDHFAFPFGSRSDYNESLINYVREAGYKSCMLNVRGHNRFNKETFCFKRMIMQEQTDIAQLLR